MLHPRVKAYQAGYRAGIGRLFVFVVSLAPAEYLRTFETVWLVDRKTARAKRGLHKLRLARVDEGRLAETFLDEVVIRVGREIEEHLAEAGDGLPVGAQFDLRPSDPDECLRAIALSEDASAAFRDACDGAATAEVATLRHALSDLSGPIVRASTSDF